MEPCRGKKSLGLREQVVFVHVLSLGASKVTDKGIRWFIPLVPRRTCQMVRNVREPSGELFGRRCSVIVGVSGHDRSEQHGVSRRESADI